MRPISKCEVESARSPWVWDLGNRVLYDFCQSYPTHGDDSAIVGKIWLIGRTYSAAIERRKGADETNDKFYEEVVAPKIRRSKIDKWIASLAECEPPGSLKSISVHKRVMDLFLSFTGLEKRSLASKYLHFHKPEAFFIYDSRARRAITRVVPRLNRIPDMKIRKFDSEYKDFVRRCVWLRQHLEELYDIALTPRELDKVLLLVSKTDT